ncbi:hypothetical protein AB4099_34155 [Bosea sp. 2KB_26]|uniref:hypothetical protein n=1 Tax=Bosea sp. 2KB_26 TaxID=3237475 RepID=UPI003F93748D
MTILRWLIGIPVLLVAGWLTFIQPSFEHRFRITLEVDTPEGLRSGTSVWSVNCTEPLGGFLRSMTGGCQTRGEAIVVSLPDGRALIGLMAFGSRVEIADIYDTAPRAFGFRGSGANGGWFSQAPSWTGTQLLTNGLIPALVTFADLGNPKTARLLSPSNDDFAKEFGLGYRFRRAMLEMVPVGIWPLNRVGITGVPTATGIDVKLPWLLAAKNYGYLSGRSGCNPWTELCLHSGMFTRRY